MSEKISTEKTEFLKLTTENGIADLDAKDFENGQIIICNGVMYAACNEEIIQFELPSPDNVEMFSRSKMIELIKILDNVKFSHRLFADNEFIYKKPNDDRVWDESGYLFEDWDSVGPGRHDGIRQRHDLSKCMVSWEVGWYIKGVILEDE